jgi:hypothetical protein
LENARNPSRAMADLDIRHDADAPAQDDYSMLEVVLWVFGILMIPGVPILMVYFFTPYSGF